jgi:hypothetical protein
MSLVSPAEVEAGADSTTASVVIGESVRFVRNANPFSV